MFAALAFLILPEAFLLPADPLLFPPLLLSQPPFLIRPLLLPLTLVILEI
jgi:hypothetical protein